MTWLDWRRANHGLTAFVAALIHLRRRIPALTRNQWWQEQDGNVSWLNQRGEPLNADEWQHGAARLQILLSDRWLIALNATAEVADMVLPAGSGAPFLHSPERIIRSSWLSGMGPRTEFAYFKGRSPWGFSARS